MDRAGYPAASQNRRLNHSPIDALIDLKVGCSLRCQVPICRLDLHLVIHLRITTVIPQRWPARRGYVRGLGVHPDVIKDLADLHARGNECDQAHLPTALRAQQREHFVNARYQHSPQVVRLRALGWRYRFRCGWVRVARHHHPRHAGHKDFSEDTYRVLAAVDSALMVIDAANGVESQTRRLIEVCRQRDTPIITFVNKMDREVREPLDILDEIERELGMPCVPMTWPVGQGKLFGGIVNLRTQAMTVFESGSERRPQDF